MASVIKVNEIQDSNGNSGITISSTGTVSLPNTSFIQTWRKTADSTGSSTYITDWEVADDVSYAGLGSTMSVDGNGYFTFPSTGLYRVDAFLSAFNGGSSQDNYVNMLVRVSQDNFSTSDTTTNIRAGVAPSQASTAFGTALVNVTDTSLVKVGFLMSSVASTTVVQGLSTENLTGAIFQRIADSQ